MKKIINRRPYNPFEQLEEFENLRSLVDHILKSVKVEAVKVPMPSNFDKRLVYDPDAILPVMDILVGDATFNYIRYRAEYVLDQVKDRIKKINTNKELGYADKLDLYESIRKDILLQYRYFDSMNPIRYMTSYDWMIVVTDKDENNQPMDREHRYPNTKLALTDAHWNLLTNTFVIRRHLLYEIIYFIDVEIDLLKEELKETRYKWNSEDWEYDLYEILFALLACEKLRLEKGDEKTFAYGFMSLFGKSDKNFAYFKNKILARKNRVLFLDELQKGLVNYGKPSGKKVM